MTRKGVYALMIIATGLILIFIAAFILKFRNHEISSNMEDWAQFGSYVGGIITPLLAIINICVFVILTLTIQQLTDKNNEATLETNKKIALMSMKHEELNNFKKVMDENLQYWRDNLGEVDRIRKVLYGYNVLEYRMMFLFPELRDSKNNKDLRKFIVEALNKHENGDIESAMHNHIPVSNIYGMLVSDLGKWTVK